MKSVQITLLLALLISVAGLADAKPNKASSFKSGFSSQKSSSTRSGASAGFGAFGSRSATPPRAPAPAPSSRDTSFGSFGGAAAPAPQRSDSALSERLSKKASQDNALRTLEARRRAEQDAMNAAARPVPSGPSPGAERHSGYSAPTLPAPVTVQQGNGGIANAITGFLFGRATSSSHAANNGYPGAMAGKVAAPAASGGGFFKSMLRTFAWLVLASIVAWSMYFLWKFLRRGKAPSQANYSFER